MPKPAALITGASAGIGEATAYLLAREGYRVVLASNVPEDLERVHQAIVSQGGESDWIEVNLLDSEDVAGLVARSEELAGPVEVLVNNAGIGLHKTLLESSDDEWARIFQINLFSSVTLARDSLRSMQRRGRGHIVNVSSASARRALSKMTAYAATKGAMHSFSQALRLEAAAHGVRVTEVLPISVRTKFFDAAGYSPKGLVQTPDWIAECILKALRTGQAEVYPSLLSFFGLGLDALAPNLVARVLAWRGY